MNLNWVLNVVEMGRKNGNEQLTLQMVPIFLHTQLADIWFCPKWPWRQKVLEIWSCLKPLGMDQTCSRMFWIGKNFKDLWYGLNVLWTKYLTDILHRTKCPAGTHTHIPILKDTGGGSRVPLVEGGRATLRWFSSVVVGNLLHLPAIQAVGLLRDPRGERM